MREDKPARSIVLEKAVHIPKYQPAVLTMRFPFTHPEKILWPDDNVSKRELADYYMSVAGRLLPHITGRPLSLLRCPEGTGGQCFFVRHAWTGTDASIRLVDTGDEKPMLAVGDMRGVLSLVQMGVLEIHVWGSTAAALETPDRLIFDLDPGEGVTWNAVKMAALDLKSRIELLRLVPFLKTTGGKGLHVVVPIAPKAGWEETKAFSRGLAQQMVIDSPSKYVASMSKSRRKGRIFIDYLRNSRSATAIAPYSTRARAGAPVAAPLEWDELPILGAANAYTLRNIGRRLAKLETDPWAHIAKAEAPLPPLPKRNNR